MNKEENKYPEPIVGAIIYNDKNEILLIYSPHKWGEYWNVPGGHVEMGETIDEALKREIKEETGLKVDSLGFMGWQEVIYPKEFFKKKHFIFLDFCARLTGGEIKKGEEVKEYVWLEPKEALKKLRLSPYTIKAIQSFLNRSKEQKENYLDKPSATEVMEGKYKRALADYQNLLKQTAKEKEEFAKYANEIIILNILPVYDNLKISLMHFNGDKVAEGIKHIINQFKEVLKSFGVEEIKTEGEKFDHNLMEAIEKEETEDEKKDGMVARELSVGYRLNGKVIRAARVAVYKFKI